MRRLEKLWPIFGQKSATFRWHWHSQLEIDGRIRRIHRERQDADHGTAFRRDELLDAVQTTLDFDTRSASLSNEARVKPWLQARPATLGAAARIPGVTRSGIDRSC